MCSAGGGGGEQVLGVNNVTGFAPRHPYRFASSVLSAYPGHKGVPVGNGVTVRAEEEMVPSSGVYPLCSTPTAPSLFPPFSSLLQREAECKQRMDLESVL